MQKILTIKPWIVFIVIIVSSLLSNTKIGGIFSFILMSLFTYWTLEVGKNLHKRLIDNKKLSLKRFQYQIGYVVIYLVLTFYLFDGGYEINNENINEYGWTAWVIIPLHILLMYCMIHTIYFLSKCINQIRNKKEGYGWYMLGFWFFPIGIWIIQPRIIKILNEKPTRNN